MMGELESKQTSSISFTKVSKVGSEWLPSSVSAGRFRKYHLENSLVRDRPFTSSPSGGGQAIFVSEMVRIGEEEVGGSAAKPLNFIGNFYCGGEAAAWGK